MATLDSDEHLLNEINTPNPRESCDFVCQIEYTLDLMGEEVESFDITNGQLPNNLVLNALTGEVSGFVLSPDAWGSEISDYLLQIYANMDDNETPFPDIPDLTVGELKELEGMHLTGANYGIKGIKAYYRDNPNGGALSKFYFTVTLTTTYTDENTGLTENGEVAKEFYIQIAPNADPKTFIISYGSDNNLVDDDMNVLTGQEYIDWRESQGHTFLSGCT